MIRFDDMMVRKIMVVLLLVLFVLPVVGQESQPEPKRTTSVALNESRVYDFGTIKEQAGKVTHRFLFTNKGRRPIAISNASAWCGCTSAAYTKQPIRPGGQGFVDVTFNPNYRPGKFVKEVVVYLNGGSEYFTLRVRGNVVGYRHPVTEERSEEHTSELQSRQYLVCRLLLEKNTKHHSSCSSP